MSDVKELVAEAWELFGSLLDSSTEALEAGTDTATVHRVVAAALRRVEDIEAYALLAASGDIRARNEIEMLLVELEELCDSLPGAQEG